MAGGSGGGGGGNGGAAGISGLNGGSGHDAFGPGGAGGFGGRAPGGDGGAGLFGRGSNGGGGGGGAYGAVVSIAGDLAPASGGRGGDGGAGGDTWPGIADIGGGGGGEGGLGALVLVAGAFRNPGGTITGGDGGHAGGGGHDPSGGRDNPGSGGSGGSGVVFALASVSLDNSGSITGGDGQGGTFGNDGGIGVDFAAGMGTLVNAGSIAGGDGAWGLLSLGVAGAGVRGNDLLITNSGSIRGGGSTDFTGLPSSPGRVDDGAGIAGANLTIVNSGSIRGGVTGSNLAIANSGSIIAGVKANGAGGDALAVHGGSNTLTLKRGSSIRGNVGLQAGSSLAIEVDAGLATSIVGAVNGTGSLTKTGAGRLKITGATDLDGGITVSAGALALGGLWTGAGSATLEAGTTLQLGGADAHDVHFASPGAMLELVDPASYTGTLFGLAPTDRIALDDTTVTSVRVQGTTLTVETTGDTLTFALAERAVFRFTVDLTGDSVLTVVASISWARGVDGDWQDLAGWKPALSPEAEDNARIGVAGTYTVTSSTANAVNELSLSNATATLAIAGGTTFTVAGHKLTNRGTVAVGSVAAGATLAFRTDATLSGGGTISLSDNAGNLIAQTGPDAITLTNGLSVAGAGQIGRGDGNLTLVNKSVIEADQSQALTIHTGNTIVNTGMLEATGGGSLVILDAVENRSNGFFANGGDITVAGAVTRRGTAGIDGATLAFETASSARVSFLGTTGQLTLGDADGFTGSVAGLDNGPGNVIAFADIGFAGIASSFRENAGGTSGRLTLSDGTDSARITLLGQYAANFTTAPAVGYTGFVLSDDGTANHGTLLSYQH
jgi:hypothetical protein